MGSGFRLVRGDIPFGLLAFLFLFGLVLRLLAFLFGSGGVRRGSGLAVFLGDHPFRVFDDESVGGNIFLLFAVPCVPLLASSSRKMSSMVMVF